MERVQYRATSLVDIQAEIRERELLLEAHAGRRAARPHPSSRTGWTGLSILRRRILG